MDSDEKFEIKCDYSGDNIQEERIIIGDKDRVYLKSKGTSTGLNAC